jgi:hypothetical protein
MLDVTADGLLTPVAARRKNYDLPLRDSMS